MDFLLKTITPKIKCSQVISAAEPIKNIHIFVKPVTITMFQLTTYHLQHSPQHSTLFLIFSPFLADFPADYVCPKRSSGSFIKKSSIIFFLYIQMFYA